MGVDNERPAPIVRVIQDELKGMLKRFAYRQVEGVQVPVRNTVRTSGGRDSNPVKGFIGINISDACDQRLVEQQRFDLRFSATYRFDKKFGGEVRVKCIRAQPREGFFEVSKCANRTPAAGVGQHHSKSVPEDEFDAGEAWCRFVLGKHFDATGHAHVETQNALVKDYRNLLASPFESFNPAARQLVNA